MIRKIILITILVLALMGSQLYALTVADYLILQDIDRYKLTKGIELRGRIVGGEPSVLRMGNAAEGHFTSYGTRYVGGQGYAVLSVEVRVYDTTQWMLHDLEARNKKDFEGVDGRTTNSCGIRLLDGFRVVWNGAGGGYYFWINNNIAVTVNYTDLLLEYPEPLEVIKEYLKKYPSTLTTYKMNEDRDKEYIKEEFERLLWVSERWVSLIQETDPKQSEKLKNAAENLEDFAQYRKVYFEDDMEKDIEFLQTSHMRPAQDEFVRAKLAEYQDWWASHKDDSIIFP